jgi:serine/threonine-protein kinase HipA
MPEASAQNSAYTLHLFAGQVMVGELSFMPDSDVFSLTYDTAWVSRRTGYALSPHLPLSGPSPSSAIRRYLENLLPEGRALDVASRYGNIQKNNIFGLIRYLGRESAGAVSFLPAGETPQSQQARIREITHAELQERIERRNELPFTVWDGQVRISVAGFQDKLLVSRAGGRIFLVDGHLSSTHILKPEPVHAALPCMVANEHFCMSLVSRISRQRYGQSLVAEVDILRLPAAVLSVRRFDRQTHPDHFVLGPDGVHVPVAQRLHIIDACQATDFSVAAKYERNLGNGKDVAHIRDGLSFSHLFATRQYLAQPAVGVRHMVLWAASTLLLGNSDAHGKNLSYFVTRSGLAVAPLYDLVSVMQYDAQKLAHDLAMAFGDVFELSEVKSFALADFCERAKVSRSFFARELVALCALASVEAVAQCDDPIYQGEERALVRGIAEFVVHRASFLTALAKDIPKFGKDLLL